MLSSVLFRRLGFALPHDLRPPTAAASDYRPHGRRFPDTIRRAVLALIGYDRGIRRRFAQILRRPSSGRHESPIHQAIRQGFAQFLKPRARY
jgi:hypothetical protein